MFETVDGDEKRRLCPWPVRWMEEPEAGLRALLREAEVVPRDRLRADREVMEQPSKPQREREASAGEHDITDLQVVRSFRYPGGRYWTVGVITHPEEGGPAVLRFSSGMRFIDVVKWPKDWADQPDEQLVAMLRRAAPRPHMESPPRGVPARRWDDPPAARA